MGAFFQFDSRLLYEEDLRSSFPQKCIICGSTKSLSIHLINWSSKRNGIGSSGSSGYHMPCVFELDKLQGVSGRELLSVLGRVELLPEPYCLPFPYYVCRSCSPVGAIVADVRPSADGLGEICEIGIASAQGAGDFVTATCGHDKEAMKLIHEAARKGGGNAWKQLPLAVRNRIRQWYEPREGADFSKAEAGIAGVVITDGRLVYRKALAVVEMSLADNVRIEPMSSGDPIKLRISSDDGSTATLCANESSTAQLQSLLRQHTAQGRSRRRAR
jgi:hypothetical protein